MSFVWADGGQVEAENRRGLPVGTRVEIDQDGAICAGSEGVIAKGLYYGDHGKNSGALYYDVLLSYGLSRGNIVRIRSERISVPKTDRCHSDRDGDCNWDQCPQTIDGEPEKTGRSCPLFDWDQDDE